MDQIKKALNDYAIARWGILLLVGFILSVNYYFYDAFSTLKDLMSKEFGFTNTQYGLFVAFYSIPNTFLLMAVIGGIVLDKLGIRRTGFIFVFFMALGAFITAYGASESYTNGGFSYGFMQSFWPDYTPQLKMMLVGRFFYGLGAETSIVVISKALVKWFRGKDLALAFGLKVGFGRLGTFAALRLSPIVAGEGEGLSNAIWLSAVLVGIGLLAMVVYIVFDTKLNSQMAEKEVRTKKDEFKLSDITLILSNKTFIYIALLCVTFYSAVFPFNAFAPDFLYHKFGVSYVESGKIASYLPLGTMFFTPFFGFIIDRYGRAATAMIFGALVLVMVHISFAFTYINPYFLMVMLGIAFSLVPAAMWPSMVKLVDYKQMGTAYGLMYSIQNIGLFTIPIAAGAILDATNPGNPITLNYTPTIIMFAILGLMGVFFAFMLKREDRKQGFGIDLPMNRER
ncbi:MAG: MFS transporter [Bacteroidetes bacterium]|nr:MFS transporter [Bacteroidota bacterium]